MSLPDYLRELGQVSRSFKANASPKLSIQILLTCYGFARVFHDTSIWKNFRIWTNGQDHKLIGLEICSVKPLYDFTLSYALKIIRKFGKVGWVQVVYFQLKQYARRGIYGLYIFSDPSCDTTGNLAQCLEILTFSVLPGNRGFSVKGQDQRRG